MNELLFFVEIIVCFSLLLLAKKLFGKEGIFAWIVFASIFAEIQVTKSINVLGINGTLGNVLFASNFLATDILTECYGFKESKKGVYLALFSVICYLIISQLTIAFIPNDIDMVDGSMKTLFALAPRVCISSTIMFFIANMIDVYFYESLRKKFNGKKMWFRNNVSTILCNCIENFFFVFGAFLFVYPFIDVVMIAISTSLIEIIISLCDTPFLYLAKKIKEVA